MRTRFQSIHRQIRDHRRSINTSMSRAITSDSISATIISSWVMVSAPRARFVGWVFGNNVRPIIRHIRVFGLREYMGQIMFVPKHTNFGGGVPQVHRCFVQHVGGSTAITVRHVRSNMQQFRINHGDHVNNTNEKSPR